MTNEPGRHRLLAILAADAVGFSRLMSLDDRQTVASLDAARAVFRAQIAAGRGSVIDMPGDFILAAFDTAIGAVEAALAVQRELATLAAPVPNDRQMHFRIGVHLGDVIESADGSVYGDGVNIAARLQTLAEPGGIVISQAVQGVVHGRLNAPLVDIGAHAVKNIAQPVRAYRVGGSPEAATNAPGAAVHTPAPLHNLPRLRTHFIGRAKQRTDCAALLQSSALVTLTGIGGSGKTRLALQVAQDVLDEYADGVWFVDLAPLQDPLQVAAAAATALGLREAPGETPLALLQRHLAARRCLIILDNCEHVLDAVVGLVEALLASCEGVAIMATSREALGVPGEQVAAVRSMPVPDGSELEALQHCDAAQLFVDRARLVAPDFRLDAGNAATVADICRRLDGIPLALELAAARVRMLTLEQIRSRLDDRFKLLTGGSRALPRHQTLQAVIQWSYDQLAPEEQRMLRQLSVFAGGWTLAAATALAGPDADEYEVLETLTRLADKSLVTATSDGDEARYSMLETVRQYAQDRLDESGDGPAARERHLDYFVALAEQPPPTTDGPALDRTMRRLDRDRENLVAAYRWSGLAAAPEERGLRLVRALLSYWRYAGQMPLAHRLAQEVIEHPNAQAPTLPRLRALLQTTMSAYSNAKYDESRRHAESALALARELGDKNLEAMAMIRMVGANIALGEHATAHAILDALMPMVTPVGGDLLNSAHHYMAELLRSEGRLDEAEPLYLQVLAWRRSDGTQFNVRLNEAYLNLVLVSLMRRDATRATQWMREAMAEAGRDGRGAVGPAIYLDTLAAVMACHHAWVPSARMVGASRAYQQKTGFRTEPVDALAIDPMLALTQAALGDDAFAAAVLDGQGLATDQAVAEGLAWLRTA